MMMIDRDINLFYTKGYVVLKLYDIEYLNEFRFKILEKLKIILGNDEVTLENFHIIDLSDKQKIDIQYTINKMIWKNALHTKIIEDNIELYYLLIGKDLDIQTEPYLRIARPDKKQDNIGFHRDTLYGNSAYEISSFIPLVDLDEDASLIIEEESHKKGEIPYTKINSDSVKKGSKENLIGVPYAPKMIDKDYKILKQSIPLNIGEVLIFNLGVIHGQEVNSSNITRWSIDIRVKNSFAPTGTKETYYRNLSSSPVTKCANIYHENNN